MIILLYSALIFSQFVNTFKQYSMKRCGRVAPGVFNSVCINMARSCICLVVSAAIWFFTDGTTSTPAGHLVMILAGIGSAVGLFTWLVSSTFLPLIFLEGVGMVGSLVLPLLLAPVLYHNDTASVPQFCGCVLLLVSLFLFANKSDAPQKKGSLLLKTSFAFLYFLGTSASVILKKYYTYYFTANNQGSISYFTFIGYVACVVFFAILFSVFYIIEKKKCTHSQSKVKLPYKNTKSYIIVAALSLYVYDFLTSYASQLPSAIYYPLLLGLCMIFTFLLDAIVFKEKVTVKKIIGLIAVLGAIVLINF